MTFRLFTLIPLATLTDHHLLSSTGHRSSCPINQCLFACTCGHASLTAVCCVRPADVAYLILFYPAWFVMFVVSGQQAWLIISYSTQYGLSYFTCCLSGSIFSVDVSSQTGSAPNCTESEFTCADGGQCITALWRCNGKAECSDGSDEEYCPSKCFLLSCVGCCYGYG